MFKTLTTALLMAAIALPVSASETPYSDAFFEDWKGVLESWGQLHGRAEYVTALERAKAIELDPKQRIKTLEGTIKMCSIMEKGRVSAASISQAITKDAGGTKSITRDSELQVRWIMAQAALNSTVHTVCPGVARL